MREGPQATAGAASLAGAVAPRPPAGRDEIVPRDRRTLFVFFLNSGAQAYRLQVDFPMDFKLFPGAQSRADDYELTDRVCVAGFIRRRKKGSGALMRAFLKRSWGVLEALRKGFRRAPGVLGTVSGGRGGSGALLGVLGASGGVFWKPLEESGRAPAEPREPSEGS